MIGLGSASLVACDDGGGASSLEQDAQPFAPDATAASDTAQAGPDATATPDSTVATSDPDATAATDAAADSSVAADTAVAADTGGTSPNPLGPRLTFSTETITVTPGQERQVCKTVNIPGDKAVDIVRIESRMHGKSHHFNLYKVIDSTKLTPVTPAEAQTHDCSPASEQLSGDAAYIYGSATPDRVMETPTGVAFHLEPGQRLILEYHGLNYTTEDIQGDVEVDLVTAAPEAVIEHYADIMWMADWGFVLPQGQETSDTAQCKVPYDVEVFMLMSHYHELGTHFEIDSLKSGQADKVYESEDWAHPIVQMFDPPLEMKKGDSFKWTCTWFNWRDHDVYPNKQSTDEMCMMFAGAYPKNAMSEDPVQCNVLF
ncbi:MAG: hypothetical protein U1F43_24670 [Myxococcota bacterium]